VVVASFHLRPPNLNPSGVPSLRRFAVAFPKNPDPLCAPGTRSSASTLAANAVTSLDATSEAAALTKQ